MNDGQSSLEKSTNPTSKQLGPHCLLLTKIFFKKLIDNNCYVDKTIYLDKIIREGQGIVFLARPRGFGKSLLIDTMKNFFEIDGSDLLFKNTEIYKLQKNWVRYPVIQLDFSAGFPVETNKIFCDSLLEALQDKAIQLKIKITSKHFSSALRQLIELTYQKFKKELVILIDEYDRPYADSYAYKNEKETFLILNSLQEFYKTLNSQTPLIHICFITGVTRLAIKDFFFGINNLRDISMNPEYAGILGFNDTEIQEYYGNQIKRIAQATNEREDAILEKMKIWHNGFQFTSKLETLYSPCSVHGYIKSDANTRKDVWSDTGGGSKFLLAKLDKYPKEALKFIVDDETVGSQESKTPIEATGEELKGNIDYTYYNVRSLIILLFHHGYLSIKEYNRKSDFYYLRFTNWELRQNYIKRLSKALAANFLKGALAKQISQLTEVLRKHKWVEFYELLNTINSKLPNHITVNQRKGLEAWFQLNLYLLLEFANIDQFDDVVRMEQSTNMGRADIVFKDVDETYIFEPKMQENPENPVYECKEKYARAFFHDSYRKTFCIGIKFTEKGYVQSSGVATFSPKGELLEDDTGGLIRLRNHLSLAEKENIDQIIKKHTLTLENVPKFLEDLGVTPKPQLIFAIEFFPKQTIEYIHNALVLCKPYVVEPNLAAILFGFLREAKKGMVKISKNKKESSPTEI